MTQKLSAATSLTTPAVADEFWIYDASAPTNLKRIAHDKMCISGVFNPTLTGDSVAGSQTYTTQTGDYTRIGNLCFIKLTLIINTKDGTTSGNINVSNLPFTSTPRNASLAVSSQSGWTVTSGRQIIARVTGGSSDILLQETDGNVSVNMSEADFTNGTQINIAGCYTVA